MKCKRHQIDMCVVCIVKPTDPSFPLFHARSVQILAMQSGDRVNESVAHHKFSPAQEKLFYSTLISYLTGTLSAACGSSVAVETLAECALAEEAADKKRLQGGIQ